MKTYLSLAAFLTVLFCLPITSCTSKSPKNYVASVGLTEGAKNLAKEDLRFLYDSYNLSLYNIQVATEASIRSTAVESTSLANEMLSSSIQIKNSVASLAERFNLDLPADINAAQKETWKSMVKQKGWEFDKAFSVIVNDNLKTADSLFTNARVQCKDETIKGVAKQALASLKAQSDLFAADVEKIKQRTSRSDEGEEEEVEEETKLVKAKYRQQ